MMKFLVSIVASAVIMTTASATAIDIQKAVKEVPEAIKVNKSGTSELETKTIARSCPPFCS